MTYTRKEIIGDCTLYLGDSREIVPAIGGGWTAVVTDPPYGMDFQSNHRADRHERIAGDDDATLLAWAVSLPAPHSRYVFCRWDNLGDVPRPKSLITWVKNNWSMGDLDHEHGRQTEVACFYPGPDHFWPAGRPSDVISAPRTGNDNHPTEKPVALMEAVVRWTAGAVLDPFMGSGTTGVACAQLGRSFIGVELHEPWFDIACRRIEDAYRRPRLFAEPVAKPVQDSLFAANDEPPSESAA